MIPLLYLLLHRMPILQYTLSIQLILSLVDCLLLQRHLFNLEIRLFRYIEVTLNTTHCILLLSRCVIEWLPDKLQLSSYLLVTHFIIVNDKWIRWYRIYQYSLFVNHIRMFDNNFTHLSSTQFHSHQP